MQAVVELAIALLLNSLQNPTGRIFTVRESGRDAHLPMRKTYVDRVQPSVDAGLPGVYLLPAANQADDHSPIRVAVHVGDEKLRFRLLESGSFLTALHEAGCMRLVPRTLRLIEDDNVFVRWTGI